MEDILNDAGSAKRRGKKMVALLSKLQESKPGDRPTNLLPELRRIPPTMAARRSPRLNNSNIFFSTTSAASDHRRRCSRPWKLRTTPTTSSTVAGFDLAWGV
ncbi:hypothetical protein KSP39_PZI016938 [Platanthera zijinensis]|uniref:Uncharacterized protein n=1 Tax=Platanthera zijinensis TaxID=2320716 RepID=A0AAP0B7N1_9ASPA